MRILARLGLAVGIVGLVYWIRLSADRMGRTLRAPAAPQAVAPAPVDFEAVVEWYARGRLFQPRADVEAATGPPTERLPWTPELVQRMERVEHSNRHFGVPADREWVRWTDPRDPKRSVTVLFAGGKVFDRFHTGF